jgi:hypothetical protein
MRYLATSFSVNMLPKMGSCQVQEISEEVFRELLDQPFVSAVGHEVTAKILGQKFGKDIAFNRTNIQLQRGDQLLVAVPQFRAEQSREFTEEEIAKAQFRFFLVDEVEKGWKS